MNREVPILMNGDMVRATLSGRKRVTRRPIKPQPHYDSTRRLTDIRGLTIEPGMSYGNVLFVGDSSGISFAKELVHHCPFRVGYRAWVRESTRECGLWNDESPARCGEYVADGGRVVDPLGFDYAWWYPKKSCPSIHMPRWASRITLPIVSVTAEKISNMSEHEAALEGFASMADFFGLWTSIYGWNPDQWVWRIEWGEAEVRRAA